MSDLSLSAESQEIIDRLEQIDDLAGRIEAAWACFDVACRVASKENLHDAISNLKRMHDADLRRASKMAIGNSRANGPADVMEVAAKFGFDSSSETLAEFVASKCELASNMSQSNDAARKALGVADHSQASVSSPVEAIDAELRGSAVRVAYEYTIWNRTTTEQLSSLGRDGWLLVGIDAGSFVFARPLA